MVTKIIEKVVPAETLGADIAEEETEEKAPEVEKGREETGA